MPELKLRKYRTEVNATLHLHLDARKSHFDAEKTGVQPARSTEGQPKERKALVERIIKFLKNLE